VAEPASTAGHPAVAAAIVTSHLGVLVSRRRDGDPPWTFPAGKIGPGESAEDAAVRTSPLRGASAEPAEGRNLSRARSQ